MSKTNWQRVIAKRLKEHAERYELQRAADFIGQHVNDRFYSIGISMQDGWVMQHCMRLIEAQEGDLQLPKAWRPSDLRGRALAESYAWKNNLCDSAYPNQDT